MTPRIPAFLLVLALSGVAAAAQGIPAPKPPPQAHSQPHPAAQQPAQAPSSQQAFPTPEEAADALIAAAGQFDVEALTKILGKDGLDLVVTADSVQDANQSKAFADEARQKHAVVKDEKHPKIAILTVGPDEWPSPIPIVQGADGQWRFDTKTGRAEVLRRRIGQNELDAIQVCHGYVEAQQDYALEKHDGAMVNQYAQRIISTPGKQDGLVWKNADGKLEGPVAEGIARVIDEGYTSRHEPYHGYYFKILKGQGPSAPHGTLDYVVRGAMIGGFALAAAPADYGSTGVMSFIVSQDGVVYQKDLGPKTLDLFRSMTRFDPDMAWHPVSEP